jgi:broad specificity phosphatase PhoE
VEGVISSDFKVGCTIHGLTPTGKVQARRAATSLIDTIGRDNLEHLILISSPFTRARETAEETLQAMQAILEFEHAPFTVSSDYTEGPRSPTDWIVHLDRVRNAAVEIRDELRERYFGQLDALPLIFYNRVWPIDAVCTFIHKSYVMLHTILEARRQL